MNTWDKTLAGAGAGAAIGGPWGAAIGAGGGFLSGLFSGGGEAPPTGYGYLPSSEAFASPIGNPEEYFSNGEGGWYMGQADQAFGNYNPYVNDIAPAVALNGALGAGARENQAMDWMQAMATGQDSVARREAALQQDQLARELMSQAATASGGRYNPALQRQALLQQSQLGAQMAGQTALNAMKEKQAAMQTYGGMAQAQQARMAQELAAQNQARVAAYNAQSGRIGQNIGAFRAETERGMATDQSRQAWLSQAVAQAERDRAAKVALEQMRQQASAGKSFADFKQQAEDQSQYEYHNRLMYGDDPNKGPRRNPNRPYSYDEYRRDNWDSGNKNPW